MLRCNSLYNRGMLPALALALSAALLAAPTERRLYPASVEASSFLWNDWNQFQENYHPLYLVDDDPKTAWVEGERGPGAGAWVRLRVTPMEGATRVRLRVRNGYQKSDKLFTANARAKTVEVKLLPSGTTKTLALADRQDWQELVVEQPAGALSAIELKIAAVHAGKKYEDLCVSDAQVFVTATTRENPAFEKQKLEQVRAWKKERLEAAQAFKAAAKQRMPIASQYRATRREEKDLQLPDCNFDDPMCHMKNALTAAEKRGAGHASAVARARKALEGKLAGFAAVEASALDKRPMPRIDGLCTPGLYACFDSGCGEGLELASAGTMGYLRADQLSVFERKPEATLAEALTAKAPVCRRDKPRDLAWAERRKDASGKERVSALFVVRCGTVEAREGSVNVAYPQLLVYDDAGRLEAVVAREGATVIDWKGQGDDARIAGGSRFGIYMGTAQVEAAEGVASR